MYMDCGGHPEYATPEILSPLDVVRYDKAGERILLSCNHARYFKNNTDGKGAYYGCHENYFIPSMDEVRLSQLLPFLVTRQLFAGSGDYNSNGFFISQKSPAVEYSFSGSTTSSRPIINQREEHHCGNLNGYRRLHVVYGDANMNQVATYLKINTTRLMITLLTEGLLPALQLVDPVASLHQVAKYPNRKISAKQGNRSLELYPVDIQYGYLEAVKRSTSAGNNFMVRLWQKTLDCYLNGDLEGLARNVDWAMKKVMFKSMSHEEALNANLLYHELGPNGLVSCLESQGAINILVTEAEIQHAVQVPPSNTRAFFRGQAVQQHRLSEGGWDKWKLSDGTTIEIAHPEGKPLNQKIDEFKTVIIPPPPPPPPPPRSHPQILQSLFPEG